MSKCLTLTLLALVVFLPLSASAGVWSTATDAPFQFTRFDAEYSLDTGLVYFFGGRLADNTTNGRIWTYDPVSGAYTDTGIDLPVPISNYRIVRLRDAANEEVLLVFGGRDNAGLQTTEVQGIKPATNTIVDYTATDPYPESTSPGSCEAVNNIAYCFGGFNGTAPSASTHIFDILAADGSRFTTGPNLSIARGYIISGVVDGVIYAAGGDGFDGTNLTPQSIVEKLDTNNPVAWDDAGVADMPITCDEAPGFGFDTSSPYTAFAGKFITAGCGQWPNEIPEVMSYDVATDTWDQSFPDLNLSRRNHAGAVIPNSTGFEGVPGMWIWGGRQLADTTVLATPEYYKFFQLDISPDTLPGGMVGFPYTATITASGGTAPYTFAVTAGSLPPGISMDTAGNIAGTPTTVGTYNFTVTVTDNNGVTGSKNYSIVVTACPTITLSPATLPNGTVGTFYLHAVAASGGTPPYVYTVSGGSLPAGLNLSASSGSITGTPTTAETANFSITATQGNGCAGSHDYSITIVSPCPTITLSPATLPDGNVGSAYSQTVTASGGTGPYSYAVTVGALPAGLSLDSGTGAITGTPTTVETASFTITATDNGGCSGAQAYTINIGAVTCLFCDEFNDGVLTGWNQIKPNWTESADVLQGTPTGRKAVILNDPEVFAGCSTCTIETTMRSAGGLYNKVWTYGWWMDKTNEIELLMKQENGVWAVKQRINRTIVAKGKYKSPTGINPNQDYAVTMSYDGSQVHVSIDGTEVITFTPVGTPGGIVGFAVKSTTGTFDYIRVN